MSKLLKNLGIVILLFVIGAVIVASFSTDQKEKEVSLGQIAEQINKGEVTKIEIDDSETNLTVYTKDNQVWTGTKERSLSLYDTLKNYGVSQEKINAVDIKPQTGGTASVILGSILPILLPFIFISALLYFLM